MSKLTKLITKPRLFFRDEKINRSNTEPSKQVAKKNIPAQKKVEIKKEKVVTKPKINSLDHFNILDDIRVILHSGESFDAGVAHLKPWIAVLMRSNVKFLILVRNLNLFEWVKTNFPWTYVSYAKGAQDIENLLNKMPYVNTVLYPSSTGNNIHLVRFSYLNHIFIGHGDSDKASSAHKGLRLYDEIWTAGEAHIDRFRNSDFNTQHMIFNKVGRPNSKKIIEACQSNWKERNYRVLYLPTWEGHFEESNYSSALISGGIIQTVANNIKLHIDAKFHHITGSRISELKKIDANLSQYNSDEESRVTIIPRTIPVDTILATYNIFICDISAVISECLAGNGPIFVYIPQDREINISNSNMAYSDYCYTFSTLNELEEKLSSVLDGNDYLEEKRKFAMNYILGYEETLNDKFVKEMKKIYEQPHEIKQLK